MTSDTTNAAAILDRLLESEKAPATRDPLRMVLDLRFAPADLKRMNCLAGRARAGTLTDEERAALANYELVGHMLSLLKSKARRLLKKTSNGA